MRTPDRRTAEKRKKGRALPQVGTLSSLLHIDLGTKGGMITSDMSPVTAAKTSLANSLLKKFQGAEDPEAESVALAGFLARNEQCKAWTLQLERSQDEEFVNGLRKELETLIVGHPWYGFGLTQVFGQCGVGPGASVGTELNDFLTKVFYSDLTTCNPRLYEYYVKGIGSPSWAEGERLRFKAYGCRLVRGSKVTTVPKNVKTRRVIASEPVLEMLAQLGIGRELRDRMRRLWGLDLRTQQTRNRALALLGSIDGRFATGDMEGASDCTSVALCNEVIHPSLNRWLMLARCNEASLPDGTRITLGMVSSMGNGFTFPLMTAIFAATVRVTYRMLGLRPTRADAREPNWGVFGDDVVCLTKAWPLVARHLRLLGYIVNENKSYDGGPFRESCGGDYFRGYDVRGVYLEKLTRLTHVASLFNRLAAWSCRHGVSLDLTMWYLGSFLKDAYCVPLHEDVTSGVQTTKRFAEQQSGAHCPWSGDLAVPLTQALAYKAWVPAPRSYAVPSGRSTWKAYKDCHERTDNPSGNLTAFLGGYIRDGLVTLGYPPSTDPPTRVAVRSTSRWDDDAGRYGSGREESWKTLLDTYVVYTRR